MKYTAALLILVIGFVSRLIPHAWNFTPVLALCLFSGAFLPRNQRLIVPLALMMLSDIVIGFYPGIVLTWLAILAAAATGLFLRDNRHPVRVMGVSCLAAVSFFLISNFGVWLIYYPLNLTGFLKCYTLAIPFFRNTLVSTIGYSFVLVCGFDFVMSRFLAKANA